MQARSLKNHLTPKTALPFSDIDKLLNFGEESYAPTSEPPPSVADISTQISAAEGREFIVKAAAAIEKDLVDFGTAWSNFSEEERLVAACACPSALEAELKRLIDNAVAAHQNMECACKASKKKPKAPATSTTTLDGVANEVRGNKVEEAKEPNM